MDREVLSWKTWEAGVADSKDKVVTHRKLIGKHCNDRRSIGISGLSVHPKSLFLGERLSSDQEDRNSRYCAP